MVGTVRQYMLAGGYTGGILESGVWSLCRILQRLLKLFRTILLVHVNSIIALAVRFPVA